MSEQAVLNSKYVGYADYKDSGVEWLGAVPEHWSRAAVWMKFSLGRGRVISNEEIADNQGLYPVYSSQTLDDGVMGYIDSFDFEGEYITWTTDGANAGTVFARKGKFNCTNVCGTLKAHKSEESFYRYYAFALSVATSWFVRHDINPKLMNNVMSAIRIPVPSIEEQRTIAAFLDYETARIDSLIDKQQRLIELLKEKRQAVISNVVSVREGEISAKLSYFVDLLPGYAFPSSGFKNEADGNIPLLRGVNVGVGKLKWEETVWWPKAEKAEQEALKDFELQEGDIVFGMDRPWIAAGARVAEVTSTDLPCLLLQRVARIRTYEDTYQPFVTLCLSSYEFKSFVEADLTGVSVPHISPDQIKSFSIRVIGFDKQKAETDTALKLCKELEAIEAKAWSAISLMQERRTALIAAAVTGKIDLRGWTPPVEEDAA